MAEPETPGPNAPGFWPPTPNETAETSTSPLDGGKADGQDGDQSTWSTSSVAAPAILGGAAGFAVGGPAGALALGSLGGALGIESAAGLSPSKSAEAQSSGGAAGSTVTPQPTATDSTDPVETQDAAPAEQDGSGYGAAAATGAAAAGGAAAAATLNNSGDKEVSSSAAGIKSKDEEIDDLLAGKNVPSGPVVDKEHRVEPSHRSNNVASDEKDDSDHGSGAATGAAAAGGAAGAATLNNDEGSSNATGGKSKDEQVEDLIAGTNVPTGPVVEKEHRIEPSRRTKPSPPEPLEDEKKDGEDGREKEALAGTAAAGGAGLAVNELGQDKTSNDDTINALGAQLAGKDSANTQAVFHEQFTPKQDNASLKQHDPLLDDDDDDNNIDSGLASSTAAMTFSDQRVDPSELHHKDSPRSDQTATPKASNDESSHTGEKAALAGAAAGGGAAAAAAASDVDNSKTHEATDLTAAETSADANHRAQSSEAPATSPEGESHGLGIESDGSHDESVRGEGDERGDTQEETSDWQREKLAGLAAGGAAASGAATAAGGDHGHEAEPEAPPTVAMDDSPALPPIETGHMGEESETPREGTITPGGNGAPTSGGASPVVRHMSMRSRAGPDGTKRLARKGGSGSRSRSNTTGSGDEHHRPALSSIDSEEGGAPMAQTSSSDDDHNMSTDEKRRSHAGSASSSRKLQKGRHRGASVSSDHQAQPNSNGGENAQQPKSPGLMKRLFGRQRRASKSKPQEGEHNTVDGLPPP